MNAAVVVLLAVAVGIGAVHKIRVRRRVVVSSRSIPTARAAVGATAGIVVAGWSGAVVGIVVAVAVEPLAALHRRRRRADLLDEQIPDVTRAIGSALRAGRNVPQALEVAASDAREPVAATLRAALDALSVGIPLDEAIERFADAATTTSAALLSEALLIGRAAGAGLPAVLDGLASSLTERRRIERDRRAATAQARMSALIVATMPVAFYAMAGSGARAQVAVLLGDPLGWGLLTAGALLEVCGWYWMRSLLKADA